MSILSVNPLYYVGFSSCTIVASLILFQGFNTADTANTVSLLTGFIITFLGVHLLNISRVPDPPLDHLNGQPNSHSALEGGLMNPRLSLQGRMSIDGWNVPADRGMDIHMGGVGGGRAGRHGRQSSLYRAQSTTLFNAFEDPEGDVPVQNGSAPHHPQHRRQQSGDLHQLPEEEWEGDEASSDRRTLLNKGTRQQQPPRPGSNSPLPTSRHGSRSQSHSPIPDSSFTDVRISPRP